MPLRTRLTIPDGALKQHLESLEGDLKFEIIRLATNGLLFQGRSVKDEVNESTGNSDDKLPVVMEGKGQNVTDSEDSKSVGVDFGDDLFVIDQSDVGDSNGAIATQMKD